MKRTYLIALIVLFTMISSRIFSQVSASINVSATVLTGISISSKSDLDFGNDIVPGVQKIVDKTNANSGKFNIQGSPNRQISISFITPSQLSSGSYSMPISFGAEDAGYQIPGGSVVAFNPSVVSTASFGTQGTMTVFLGGKVIPASTQQSGYYTGTITVNLQYTGN